MINKHTYKIIDRRTFDVVTECTDIYGFDGKLYAKTKKGIQVFDNSTHKAEVILPEIKETDYLIQKIFW